jgi:hypothetical protein
VAAVALATACSSIAASGRGRRLPSADDAINLVARDVFADYFPSKGDVFVRVAGLPGSLPSTVSGFAVRVDSWPDFDAIRVALAKPQYLYAVDDAAQPTMIPVDDPVELPLGTTESTLTALQLTVVDSAEASVDLDASLETVGFKSSQRIRLHQVADRWRLDRVLQTETTFYSRQ